MPSSKLVLVGLGIASGALAQRTYLVDAGPNGAPPPQGAGWPSLSQTGRYVAFDSSAPNLVVGDTNAASDVFVRDMQTGAYELVSRAANGAPATGASFLPRLSPDARFVAFQSAAPDIVVPSDINGWTDVFVRDRQLGTTVKVSFAAGGGESIGTSTWSDVSDDGARVCFSSDAPDIFPGDPYVFSDVFVRDLALGTTTLISRSPGGPTGNAHSYFPTISGDGRFVAFTSEASDLIAGDTNNASDVFVHDLTTGVLVRASVDASGAQANGASGYASLSADGRYVAFQSAANDLVTPDVGTYLDIFVRDLALGTTARVSQSASGVQANYSSWYPTLSADGRYVGFLNYAWNLLPQPSQHPHAVVRVDRVTGQVIETQGSVCGVPVDQVIEPTLSPDGLVAAFACRAVHATPNDVNGTYDVFLHDTTAAPVPPRCSYCVVAPTSNGCSPSISASGSPSATAGSGFVLTVNSVEGQRRGLFLHSPYSIAVPWGSGGPSYRCTDFHFGVFGHQSSGGTLGQCDGALSFDVNVWLPGMVAAGADLYVQGWFRDPNSIKGSHFSDALSLVVGP